MTKRINKALEMPSHDEIVAILAAEGQEALTTLQLAGVDVDAPLSPVALSETSEKVADVVVETVAETVAVAVEAVADLVQGIASRLIEVEPAIGDQVIYLGRGTWKNSLCVVRSIAKDQRVNIQRVGVKSTIQPASYFNLAHPV